MNYKKIGQFLKQLRIDKKLSQQDLVNQLMIQEGIEGLTVSSISKWEHGDSLPNIDNLKMLSKFFNISIDEMLSYHLNESIQLNLIHPFLNDYTWDNYYNETFKPYLKDKTIAQNLIYNLATNKLSNNELQALDILIANNFIEANEQTKDSISININTIRKNNIQHQDWTNEQKFYEAYRLLFLPSYETTKIFMYKPFTKFDLSLKKEILNYYIPIEKDSILMTYIIACNGDSFLIPGDEDFIREIITLLIDSGGKINRNLQYQEITVKQHIDYDRIVGAYHEILSKKIKYIDNKETNIYESNEIPYPNRFIIESLSKNPNYKFFNTDYDELCKITKAALLKNECPIYLKNEVKWYANSIRKRSTGFEIFDYRRFDYEEYINGYDLQLTTELKEDIKNLPLHQIFNKYFYYKEKKQ